VDAAAFTANAGVLPGQGGNAGRLLITDGATAAWGPQWRLQAVAADADLALDTSYSVDTSAPRSLRLPPLSSAAPGQRVEVRDGLGRAATFKTSIRPFGTDALLGGVTSPVVIDVDRGAVMFESRATGWLLHPL
jgi:hypothetical protein